MAFTNRIRLPLKLHKPQFVEDRQEYRKANGETVTLSVVIRKVYEGITDSLPEKIHERLKIALAHDSVQIEGDKYVGVVTQEGDYQIEWSDFLSRPIAQAKFKANVSPFNATNSNCGTCEQYSQVVCNDDDVGTVDADTDYNVGVVDNDAICCSPFTQSIVYYNPEYISAIVTNPDFRITFHVDPNAPTVNGVILATYRITCANGMYDEANIIANINGVAPASCLAPTGLNTTLITDTTATFSWTASTSAPDHYEWEVHLISNLGVPVQTGSSDGTSTMATGLTPGTQYRFYIKSDCLSSESNFVYIDFTTDPPSGTDSCGQYELINSDSLSFHRANYIDCNGDQQSLFIPPFHQRQICALQNSPGNPVDITADPEITITYLGLC